MQAVETSIRLGINSPAQLQADQALQLRFWQTVTWEMLGQHLYCNRCLQQFQQLYDLVLLADK